VSTYNPPQGACRKCGNPDGYDTFWRDADDPHYACGRCGEREKPMTTENMPSEGPYKMGDLLSGKVWLIRLATEEGVAGANIAFAQGRSASDAEHARKIKEFLAILKRVSAAEESFLNWWKEHDDCPICEGNYEPGEGHIHNPGCSAEMFYNIAGDIRELLSKYSAKGEGT